MYMEKKSKLQFEMLQYTWRFVFWRGGTITLEKQFLCVFYALFFYQLSIADKFIVK